MPHFPLRITSGIWLSPFTSGRAMPFHLESHPEFGYRTLTSGSAIHPDNIRNSAAPPIPSDVLHPEFRNQMGKEVFQLPTANISGLEKRAFQLPPVDISGWERRAFQLPPTNISRSDDSTYQESFVAILYSVAVFS